MSGADPDTSRGTAARRRSRREVPALLAGVRVDRGVAMVADVSRGAAAQLIAAGRVLVDGSPVSVGRAVLREGATLTIVLPAAEDAGVAAEPGVRFEVVYADDDVAVVDKPAGLVVHPGAGHARGDPGRAVCWPGSPTWPTW